MAGTEPRWLQVVGWSNTGKTTLLTALVQMARRDGQRVAAVKWSHHPIGDTGADTGGKDAERLYGAGARPVFRVGADGWVEMGEGHALHETAGAAPQSPTVPQSLRERLGMLAVDWLLVEGGRRLPTPKIVLAPGEVPDVAPPVVLWLGGGPDTGELAGMRHAAYRSPDAACRLIWTTRLDVSAPLDRIRGLWR